MSVGFFFFVCFGPAEEHSCIHCCYHYFFFSIQLDIVMLWQYFAGIAFVSYP